MIKIYSIIILFCFCQINKAQILGFEGQPWFTDNWSENGINWFTVSSDIRGYSAHTGSLHYYSFTSGSLIESDKNINVNSLYIYVNDSNNNNTYVDIKGYTLDNNLIKIQRVYAPAYSTDYSLVNLSGFINISKLYFEFDGNPSIYVDDISYTEQGAVPVELTSFFSIVQDNTVILKWETATEVNNYGFQVEQASSSTTPSQDWIEIGFVEGAGNSNSPKEYSFADENPPSGKIQYRLKQIDIDGSFTYSEVVEVENNIPTKFELYQNYPNPFNPTTTINYVIASIQRRDAINRVSTENRNEATVQVLLKVYDALGRKVATLVNKKQAQGKYSVQFNATGLPSGIYFYTLRADNFVQTRKMILMK